VTDEQFTQVHHCLVAIAGELAGIRAAMTLAMTPKGARPSIPERCNGIDKNLCAEQDGEWVSKATLADFSAAKCKGCGHMKSGLG
jgi:hypothetical protein